MSEGNDSYLHVIPTCHKKQAISYRRKYAYSFAANDLQQLIKKPTRVCETFETIIDLICVTDNEHRVVQWEVITTAISYGVPTFRFLLARVKQDLSSVIIKMHSFKG